MLGNVFRNQEVLASGQTAADDQFAVLSRLVVTSMNALILAHNALAAHELLGPGRSTRFELRELEEYGVAPITYESINEMFHLYAQLKARPDFKEHSKLWYTGGDMSTLPPLPTPPATVSSTEEALEAMTPPTDEELAAPEEDAFPEGSQVFGGDYSPEGRNNGSSNGNQIEGAQAEQGQDEAPEVPSVPRTNGAGDRPGNAEAYPEVPQV